jgi:hypothetical protein
MSPGPEALKLRRQLVRTNAAPTNLTGELRLKVNGAGTSKGEAGQTGPGFWAGVLSGCSAAIYCFAAASRTAGTPNSARSAASW